MVELVSLALAVVPLSLVLPLLPPLVLPSDDVPPEVSPLPLPLVPVELHAASPRASKHAKSTLCSLRFMINSFGWVFFRLCVTMPRATRVRGAFLNDVPVDPAPNEADQTVVR